MLSLQNYFAIAFQLKISCGRGRALIQYSNGKDPLTNEIKVTKTFLANHSVSVITPILNRLLAGSAVRTSAGFLNALVLPDRNCLTTATAK